MQFWLALKGGKRRGKSAEEREHAKGMETNTRTEGERENKPEREQK